VEISKSLGYPVADVFITISSNTITVSSDLITKNFKLLSYFLQITITISSNSFT